MADPRLCSISECGKPVLCRGYCSAHYSRFRLYGDPLGGSYFRQKQPTVCSVEGCGRKPKAHKLCELHYGRLQKRGTTDDHHPKETKLCSVDGCEHPHVAKGYCGHHYRQWKAHGNPLIKFRATPVKSEEIHVWIHEHLALDGSDCLIWPFSRTPNGYGQMQDEDGNRTSAHRYICKAINGPPPSGLHFAAHDCGHGDQGCVHPKHLYWATPSQNTMDRYRHGTMLMGESHPASKLSQADIDRIRTIGSSMTQRDMAKLFGVCKSTIGNILRGDSWSTS